MTRAACWSNKGVLGILGDAKYILAHEHISAGGSCGRSISQGTRERRAGLERVGWCYSSALDTPHRGRHTSRFCAMATMENNPSRSSAQLGIMTLLA